MTKNRKIGIALAALSIAMSFVCDAAGIDFKDLITNNTKLLK